MQIHGHRSGSILNLIQRLEDCPAILRWGGPMVAGAINGQAHILDGLEQLLLFSDKGVPIPTFQIQPPTLPYDGLWLARRRNHSQGKDIIPVGIRVRHRRNWVNSDFFVRYVEHVVREWRIHVLNGHSIARGVKVWAGTGEAPTAVPVIRSRRLQWHMRHDVDPPKTVRATAKAAVAAVGYDLGAVDLLEREDGSVVVLEVNSRPAIRDEYTLAAYEAAIRRIA